MRHPDINRHSLSLYTCVSRQRKYYEGFLSLYLSLRDLCGYRGPIRVYDAGLLPDQRKVIRRLDNVFLEENKDYPGIPNNYRFLAFRDMIEREKSEYIMCLDSDCWCQGDISQAVDILKNTRKSMGLYQHDYHTLDLFCRLFLNDVRDHPYIANSLRKSGSIRLPGAGFLIGRRSELKTFLDRTVFDLLRSGLQEQWGMDQIVLLNTVRRFSSSRILYSRWRFARWCFIPRNTVENFGQTRNFKLVRKDRRVVLTLSKRMPRSKKVGEGLILIQTPEFMPPQLRFHSLHPDIWKKRQLL